MGNLVLLDWGSSRLRAWRVGDGGAPVERRESARGILAVADGAFAAALEAEVGDWIGPRTRILASGMITSRQGWVETGYRDCPAALGALADGLVRHRLGSGAEIAFAPGLRMADPPFDVMRGEEVQLLGLGRDGLVLLPGTHSKWARVADGRVERFATFLTGELHAVLLAHTIVGRLARGAEPDDAAFDQGLADGARAPETGGLARAVFSGRSLVLAGRLAPEGVAAYLSGLLIGSEIAEGVRLFGDEPPTVIASETLARAYSRGFASRGVATRPAPPDAAARGLLALASEIGWADSAPAQA